jgi:hypothetical protein
MRLQIALLFILSCAQLCHLAASDNPIPWPNWQGYAGDTTRSSQSLIPLPQHTPSLGANFTYLSTGKSHGSLVTSRIGNTYVLAWMSRGLPYVYMWRGLDNAAFSTPVVNTTYGDDIISDSFDALLLNDHDCLLFSTVAFYNTSLGQQDAVITMFDVGLLSGMLTVKWQLLPTYMSDAAAFISSEYTRSTPLLLLLVSQKRQIFVLDGTTGVMQRAISMSYNSECDGRSSMSLNQARSRVYVVCYDSTFGKHTLQGFDVKSGTQLFSTVSEDIYSYYPTPLSIWTAVSNNILCVTQQIVSLFDASNGTLLWRQFNRISYMNPLITYAQGGPKGNPILYLLGQSPGIYPDPATTWLMAMNSTGALLTAPYPLPYVTVDQFQGTMLVDPDGVTIVVNGWNNRPYPIGSQYTTQLVCVKLVFSQDPKVAPAFKVMWVSPSLVPSNGRFAIYAAPRLDGSIIVGGWEGLVQFKP